MNFILTKIKHYIQSETVLVTSGLAAFISTFFVPPSASYLEYIDFRVLSLLFCLMAVVAGFQKTGIFLLLSEKILDRVANTRSLGLVLILLCFFTSMWITNDVALITFVPFAILVLTLTDQKPLIILVVVLQTVAANLGSMLTPIGNPQNLYLYSYYNIPIISFFSITLPYTIISFLLLCFASFFIKKEHLSFVLSPKEKADKKQPYYISFYCLLFLICLACVIRLIDYRITIFLVFGGILIFDRSILKKVDYSLLLTFVCFFLFVGNIGNIPVIKDALATFLTSKELPVSILASQLISNVPAAVLLSAFTSDYKSLLLGTNLGGLGTLVASLASLISYKFYYRIEGSNSKQYLYVFTLVNILFLILLILFHYVITMFIM